MLSKHTLVRAHLYEILWVRFRKHTDAGAAIDARVEAASALDAESDWPTVVKKARTDSNVDEPGDGTGVGESGDSKS